MKRAVMIDIDGTTEYNVADKRREGESFRRPFRREPMA
jgi:hypothetical protein